MYNIELIIPVYNGFRGVPGSAWMEQSINSAITFRTPDTHIIIVDDGSVDGSGEFISGYKNFDFIDVITLRENKGISSAMNIGVLSSTCQYIVSLSCDDLLPPNKIRSQSEYLNVNSSCAMVGGQEITINDLGELIANGNLAVGRLDFRNGDDIKKHLFNGGCWNLGPMFRRDKLIEVGLYDEENFAFYSEDYDMLLRMAERYDFGFIDITTYITRSSTSGREQQSLNRDLHQSFTREAFKRSLVRRGMLDGKI